jgi:cyclic pyranopterin phosphate synthase
MAKLTHFDQDGAAHMVDVGAKSVTERMALAKGEIRMSAETLALIKQGRAKKGDVLGVARLAGIMAAKKTPDLIPLCHGIALASVQIDFSLDEQANRISIAATCKATDRTGVEMEAMVAVSVAALTIYDMCKSADRSMRIGDIRLTRKTGGKSGAFEAD